MGLRLANWNIEEMTGYKPKTTFYTDFSIADHFGMSAVRDTYNRSFKSWKDDYEYLTELSMALNWKIWEHQKTNEPLARLYDELWRECDEYCCTNLKGEALKYYYSTTD